MTLARAAESVAERDKRYTAQFGEFTKRLEALANLEDLPQIRAAIVRGAKEIPSPAWIQWTVTAANPWRRCGRRFQLTSLKLEEAEHQAVARFADGPR